MDQKFGSWARSNLWNRNPGCVGLSCRGGGLHRLLLLPDKPAEAVGEGAGDQEVHLLPVCLGLGKPVIRVGKSGSQHVDAAVDVDHAGGRETLKDFCQSGIVVEQDSHL